jgi:hypothetical protein
MAAREAADMQVHWHVLMTTAFLGTPTESGFYAEGTCFFLAVSEGDLDFIYVVTCAHVVQPFVARHSNEPNPQKIYLRINRKNGPPKVVDTIRGDWISHKCRSVDICVYPFRRDEWDADDQLAVSYPHYENIALTPNRYPEVGFSLGDEVFIIGAFIGRIGEKKNIPIVRIATTAAMPEEPVWGGSQTRPAFLLETKSLGGTSGSPFFLHTRPERQRGNWGLPISEKGEVQVPYLLVGMVQGTHSGQYGNDFVVSDDDAQKIISTDADFNAGIAIGLPVELIKEVIDRDELKEARMAAIRAKQRVLVDVAARKRPQGDQT